MMDVVTSKVQMRQPFAQGGNSTGTELDIVSYLSCNDVWKVEMYL